MNLTENFMYTDCGERAMLLWLLNYHFPKILASLDDIPQDSLFRIPTKFLNPPGWIFAHLAVKERDHIAGFAQGINDVPKKYAIFRNNIPSEQQMHAAITDSEELKQYYQEVRKKTAEYLDSITDSDLKKTPGYVNQDPIREFFVMTIQHQYYHWAQIEIVRKFLLSEKKIETANCHDQ